MLVLLFTGWWLTLGNEGQPGIGLFQLGMTGTTDNAIARARSEAMALAVAKIEEMLS